MPFPKLMAAIWSGTQSGSLEAGIRERADQAAHWYCSRNALIEMAIITPAAGRQLVARFRERVVADWNTRTKGKTPSRPKRVFRWDEALRPRAKGLRYRQ